MLVSELFDIKYGINLELDSLEQSDDADAINFVARTAENNGVVARVKRIPGKEPQPAGILTCAGGGSVLSTFVQDKPFYSGRDLYLLIPKKEMSLEEKLFYCHVIKMNAYRYSYGRQANRTLKNINLPPLPDWLKKYKIDYTPIDTKIKHKELPFDTTKWKSFKLGNLFTFKPGKIVSTEVLSEGNDLFYCGAKKDDNGVIGKYAYDAKYVSPGNCMVFICDGQGSIGYNNYMDKDFFATVNLVLGYNEHLNKYIGLFVTTVLDLERPKFSFGRKRKKTLSDTNVKLPADKNGNPDWDYMEKYIKSLPYSDLI